MVLTYITFLTMASLEVEPNTRLANPDRTAVNGAVLIAVFPVAPLVALIVHANFNAYWLTWTSTIWMLPAWLIACTLIAGALMLPIAGLGWVLARLTEGLASSEPSRNESSAVFRTALLATFAFWAGSVAGGFLFILWKAARHSFLTFS